MLQTPMSERTVTKVKNVGKYYTDRIYEPLANITGIRMLGAPRAAIVATLEPVVGVSLAALLLNEQPAAVQLLGGALILVAAVLLQLGGRTASEHEAVG